MSGKIGERMTMLGMTDVKFEGSPVTLWDVFGKQGHPLRATVSEMGPLLVSRILQLNDTQEGVLTIAFRVADENGWLLLDLKDLQSLLQFVGENADEFTMKYGNVSKATIGAIQRGLLQLEQQGAEQFFGEPAVRLDDFMQTLSGKGVLNLLAADDLINSPKLYSTFLLWLLSELFEELPEAGDLEKPKLVFFFDEAHLLFDDATDAFLDSVGQTVRLIRSKGVGVFFVSQNPQDLPAEVLGQLGSRIQHALRAFTPDDAKALRATVSTYPKSDFYDLEELFGQMGIGEAAVTVLSDRGIPTPVVHTRLAAPAASMGPAPDVDGAAKASPLCARYGERRDARSAHEILEERLAEPAPLPPTEADAPMEHV